jgi:hypothetical protein
MFIICSVNATPANPAEADAPQGETTPEAVSAKPTRSQVLLDLILQLINAGFERLAIIRSKASNEESHDIGNAFGTFNICVIAARIIRGLKLTAALPDRVTENAPRIDHPPSPRISPDSQAASHRQARKRKPSEAADNATLLRKLPTDREIADMLRHRTIGAVLAQICADLGINVNHPMWQDVRYLIAIHGGHQPPVIARHFQRLETVREKVRTSIAPGWTFYRDPGPDPDFAGPPPDTTGPPPGTVAPEPNRTGPHRGGPAIRHARALTRPSPSAPRRSSPPFVSAR